MPDDIHEGDEVLFLEQNPGGDEVRVARPMVGKTGQAFNQSALPSAGLDRADVSVANVLRCRWKGTDKVPPGPDTTAAKKHCEVHLKVPASVRLIVAQGAHAWSATGQPGSITDWRGFLGPSLFHGRPVLGTLHLSDVLHHNPKMKIPNTRDLQKIGSFLRGEWPSNLPDIWVYDNDQERMFQWFAAAETGPYVTLDTEYDPVTKQIWLIGLKSPTRPDVFLFPSNKYPLVAPTYAAELTRLIARTTVVMHNIVADVGSLDATWGIKYEHFKDLQDTMLAHATLWAEWPHTLEFLASVYGHHRKLKHLKTVDPYTYNAGDVIDTESAWLTLQDELRKDPGPDRVYREQSLRLVPVLLRSGRTGIRTDRKRIAEAYDFYRSRLSFALDLARAATGRATFNLGAPEQLKRYLYDDCGYPEQRPSRKDATDPRSIDGDAIATLRGLVLPFDQDERLSPEYVEQRVSAGADPVLEARVLYADAQQIISHYLAYGQDAKEFRPEAIPNRFFPGQLIHAQASGRWSTTDPPLAQLPAGLRDILIPDEGHTWISWDWDQIELRLLAALAGDRPYLDAFDNGWDIHTLNACDIFKIPYPPDKKDPHKSSDCIEWRTKWSWEGKDDIRRVFAKRFVYRLNYGGDPASAGDIPGAKQLGLTKNDLVQGSNSYLAGHLSMARWRGETATNALRTRRAYTWAGRRRILLGPDKAIIREAYNHPMQGGVSDIFNYTVLEIASTLPELTFMYGMHDSQNWQMPTAMWEDVYPRIQDIVTRKYKIGPGHISFPATFKVRHA